MIHKDIIQGSDEWFDVKRGKVSATGIVKIQAKGKGVTRDKYKAQLILERLTGLTAETYSNDNMERGIELEDVARQMYEAKNLVIVETVGFIDHPTIELYGVSPDGLVADGMVEIKVVQSNTMLEYIYSREIPTNYQKQMQSQMDAAAKPWNDFCAYCPEMPEHLQLLILRLERDAEVIKQQNVDVIMFNREVAAAVTELENMEL
jgi:putative phage-type endonuclease